jgi:hypothetical protein
MLLSGKKFRSTEKSKRIYSTHVSGHILTYMTFYVYVYKDPEDGTIFYVGKGKDGRAHSHLRRRRLGLILHNDVLQERIDSCLKEGRVPNIEIIRYFDVEDDAFAFETQLIRQIGLEHLANKTDVAWPCRITPESLRKRGITCKNNMSWRTTMQSKEHRDKLSKAVKQAIADRGGRPPLSQTHREAVSRGLKGKQAGIDNANAKNTPEQIYVYLEAVMKGSHWKKTAKEMGIANAFNVIHRRCWTHIEAPPGYKVPVLRKKVDQTIIDTVIKLYESNHTKKYIADQIGFTATTVNNILKIYLQETQEEVT